MTKNLLITFAVIFSLLATTVSSAHATGTQNPPQQPTTAPAVPVTPAPAVPSGEMPKPSPAASSTDAVKSNLEITAAEVRMPISPNNNTAAYMVITNTTDQDIVIIGASAFDIANNTEIHKSAVNEKGVAKMFSVDKLVIPAKTSINLVPGGTHIMLMDLKKKLNSGDIINITLKIDGQKEIVVPAIVK